MNYVKVELVPDIVKFTAISKNGKEKTFAFECYTTEFMSLAHSFCFSFSRIIPETEIQKTKEEKVKAWKEWVHKEIENSYCGNFLDRATFKKYKSVTDFEYTYSFRIENTRNWNAEQIFKTFTIDQIIEQYGETALETIKKLK